jgi:hypothetical protein
VSRLQYERLYFNSVHYQGYGKKKLVEDVCNIMANARFTSPPPRIEDTDSISNISSRKSDSKQKKKANDYVIKDSDVQRACDSYYLTRSSKPTSDDLLLQDRHELEKKTITTFILGTIVRWIMQYIKL